MQSYELTQQDVDLIFQALAGIATVQMWQLVIMLIGLGLFAVLVILVSALKYR